MKYLLDPTNITNFSCKQEDLELQILFWICAAGKSGVTAAKGLDRFLTNWSKCVETPFEIVRYVYRDGTLAESLKNSGIGCYNNKAETMQQIVHSGLDLATCSVDDLETIKGIGKKTSRGFMLHTRRNQKYACLDRHILRHMKDLGYDVPKSTPFGKKYKEIEKQFLEIVAKSGMTTAAYDLMIWKKYRQK